MTNLENSKRLWELSGWGDAELFWHYYDGVLYHRDSHPLDKRSPAYDSDYLLGKLPIKDSSDLAISVGELDYSRVWSVHLGSFECSADTPADALALLAINLFESGILTKEQTNGI